MHGLRTDLAMESADQYQAPFPGVRMHRETRDGITRTVVDVDTPEAARALGKEQGRFITLSAPELPTADAPFRERVARQLAQALSSLLPGEGEVLVIGLGNRHVTADALGAQVVERTLVTRHMRTCVPGSLKCRLRGVCAVAPGVLGVTGMETAEMVRGIVERVRPAAVIAIDALAAMETNRICTTVQVTDTGISPGSGIGNHRMGLNRATLGVPVVAVGVPMVVYAATIARDALEIIMEKDQDYETQLEQIANTLVERISGHSLGEMVVTPRDIDLLVENLSQTLGLGINLALHPRLSPEEIPMLMH